VCLPSLGVIVLAMLPKAVFLVFQYMESGMMLKVAMNLHTTERIMLI
jgi:hypothetical protein